MDKQSRLQLHAPKLCKKKANSKSGRKEIQVSIRSGLACGWRTGNTVCMTVYWGACIEGNAKKCIKSRLNLMWTKSG